VCVRARESEAEKDWFYICRFITPKPNWSVYREASFGYGMLQVVNSTHAHWAWHRNEDIETVVGDELWIQNRMDPAHPCNV
jgi:hypothetical protein